MVCLVGLLRPRAAQHAGRDGLRQAVSCMLTLDACGGWPAPSLLPLLGLRGTVQVVWTRPLASMRPAPKTRNGFETDRGRHLERIRAPNDLGATTSGHCLLNKRTRDLPGDVEDLSHPPARHNDSAMPNERPEKRSTICEN